MYSQILIKVKHLLAEPISFLVNESFACGVFPDILKSAVITLIFKKDDPMIVSNYRRISVLHWLSQIFKKSISKRIILFANEMSVFSSCQFGFRSGMSTVDAIVRLVEFIYDSLNGKSHTLCIFVDLSKGI